MRDGRCECLTCCEPFSDGGSRGLCPKCSRQFYYQKQVARERVLAGTMTQRQADDWEADLVRNGLLAAPYRGVRVGNPFALPVGSDCEDAVG